MIRDALEQQSTQWQDALNLATQGAEDLHREEAAREQVAGKQLEFLWDEHRLVNHQLGWYEEMCLRKKGQKRWR